MLNCESENDFLAKVHCVRLAFDEVIRSSENRDYFKITARELISSFFSSTQQVHDMTCVCTTAACIIIEDTRTCTFVSQDPSKFCHAFDDLTDYLESEEGWKIAVEELTSRKVTLHPNTHTHTILTHS